MSVHDVAWRAQVESHAGELADELRRVRALALSRGISFSDAAEYRIADRNITLARETAASTPRLLGWTWLRRWASGSDVETAWSALHEAEAALVMILPSETLCARLPDIRAGLTTTLAGDGRLEEYSGRLKQIEGTHPEAITREQREHLRVIESAVDSVSDTAHSNVRNYRNWLLIVTVVVIVGLVVVAVAHGANPRFLYIQQTGAPRGAGADVAQIESAGAAGGLLMALVALIRLTVFSGPVALPLWQSLVRIPAGAAAALVGAMMLQGQVISSIVPQPRSGLLGYAAVFGAAPELVLRFLDERVNKATAAARPKSDPLKPVPAQGPDHEAAEPDRTFL